MTLDEKSHKDRSCCAGRSGTADDRGGARVDTAAIQECDRSCLIRIMDSYMNAIFQHDPKRVPPLALDVRMTENTGHMDIGEGMLWRSKVEPTGFKIYVADPLAARSPSRRAC